MSLLSYRDHCRKMATATHRPDCYLRPGRQRPWFHREQRVERDDGTHFIASYAEPLGPDCPGCVTDQQRAQWRALADEATAHLARSVTA